MISKTILCTLLFSIVTLCLATPLSAKDTQAKQDKNAEKIKEKVKRIVADDEKVTKKVKLYNGATYVGTLSQPSDESFVVTDKDGHSNTVRYLDVKAVDKKDVSTGLKVGIGAGAAVVVLLLILPFFARG